MAGGSSLRGEYRGKIGWRFSNQNRDACSYRARITPCRSPEQVRCPIAFALE